MNAAMPTAFGLEYGAITHELDPELRGEALLSLAGRGERAHRPDLAIQLYQEILNSAATPNRLKERAQRRLDAHRGEGWIGDRAEILVSRFVEEATEPTTLLAMTVAGAAFRVSRFLTLARLSSSAEGSLLTRGLGARAVANLTGFGVEATVFPFAGRLGNLALGREQEWSARALGGELASSFLMLGALRAGGLATGALANPRSYFRPLAQQAGMFGGILLGHELEVRAGLRERTRASIALVDGLSTLLTFNVAGRLNHGLLGEGMRRWERSVEVRTQALSQPLSNPPPPPLFQRGGLVAASLGGISPEPFGPDRFHMSGEGDGKGRDDPRRRTTLPGLTRPSLLPKSHRPGLFLYNADFRVANLSLRAREITHAPNGGHVQKRVQQALENYLQSEKDPAVLIYTDHSPFEAAQHGELRLDLFRYFRDYQLPDDFTLTVVVPATMKAVHYSKDPRGTIQFETVEVVRKAPSREASTPPLRPDSVSIRVGSRPDANELKLGMERLIGQVASSAEQNPAFRLGPGQGRIGHEELESFAEVFSANLPVANRRFTVVWREKGGGQVQFQREGEAIRAEWKAHQAPQKTFWYLPSPVLGQFQFVPEGDLAAYAWQAEPGYSQNMDRRLQTLWTNMGVPGAFDKTAPLEEGGERRGVLLARIAQHWVQGAGNSSKTWSHDTLPNLLEIHRTLELALAHLDLGLVRRFQERMSRQILQKYRQTVEAATPPNGEPRLLPLEEKLEPMTGERYLPLDQDLRAAFIQHLYHGLKRPRFPLENHRLLRDAARLGEVYRETLRHRILPLFDTLQKAIQISPRGDWTYLMTADLAKLSETEKTQRREIEAFISEIPDHARILAGQGGFHRDFLREVFLGNQALLRPYLIFRNQLGQLPPDLRTQYRVDELPSREEIEARMARTRR